MTKLLFNAQVTAIIGYKKTTVFMKKTREISVGKD